MTAHTESGESIEAAARHAVRDQDREWMRERPQGAVQNKLLANPLRAAAMQPFYAIRPLYISLLRWVPANFISPAAYSGICIVVLWWLGSGWWAALIALFPPLLSIASQRTPDALSCFLVLAGLCALWKRNTLAGLSILAVSLFARTDNIVVLLLAVGWLAWARRIRLVQAGIVGTTAIAAVFAVQHFAGTYGWWSLITINLRPEALTLGEFSGQAGVLEYLRFLMHGIAGAAVLCAPWAMIGIVAWLCGSMRPLLLIALLFVPSHMVLLPIPEDRYFLWTYLVSAIALIRVAQGGGRAPGPEVLRRRFADLAQDKLRQHFPVESRLAGSIAFSLVPVHAGGSLGEPLRLESLFNWCGTWIKFVS